MIADHDAICDIIQLVRVVLDTSVLISALRSSTGASAEIVRFALRREIAALMDYKLACEYREVALRAEQLDASGKSRMETASVLDAIEAVSEPVYVAFRHRPLSPDVSDDMVLDVAINGAADAIVTNNTRDFLDAARSFRVGVLTPAEMLKRLRRRK